MKPFTIKYQALPPDAAEGMRSIADISIDAKEIFWDRNISLRVCTAMIMDRKLEDMIDNDVHRILYGNYLGGFLYEGYELLPPLCILNVVSEDMPYNAVYYNRVIYDPRLGTYQVDTYLDERVKIVSYIQIFIEEAYDGVDWRPYVPNELLDELNKDTELSAFWEQQSPLQQSRILNFIYPFSKPSSLKEARTVTQKLKPKQVERILNHIKTMYRPQSDDQRSVWDELYDFEHKEGVDILKRCGLTRGMAVLDMGCGHAHYTIPAAIAVGDGGKVIAVDHNKTVLNAAMKRASEKQLTNISFLNTSEAGLIEYRNHFDFLLLYDVLHMWKEEKEEKIRALRALLKEQGILSLALYNEIEHRIPSDAKPTPKGSYSTVPISHEEAIKPYIVLMEACGFKLNSIIPNGGVHFDNFHSPYHWHKYGEVRVKSLERRNIYNFIKVAMDE